MTIDTSDFRTGMGLVVDNEVYTLVDFQHVKPGKGGAFVRTKLKNVKNGSTLEKTFRAGEKFQRAHLERKPMQYLYSTGDEFYFMDMDSYEQMAVPAVTLGSDSRYLKEGVEVAVLTHDGRVMGVELPITLELKITQTDPGLRGDTASGGSKPATLETGAVIQVPLFITEGEVVKVDTRTDSYLGRVRS
ncbi:MAG: elongation factor P [Chloroflexi bacterium]|nr:elongation factor P [Chloroflexota bacterium]